MNNLVRISGITPLETMELPAELNGQNGLNRAVGNRPQIAAQNDIDAIKAWLARYIDTKTTLDSYRKEAERLLLWSVIELTKPLSSLTHEDLLVYQRFLVDPHPAERWVMTAGRKWARNHPEWRPFVGPLSSTSQRQAVVILNAMFAWLVTAGYLVGNPLSLSRQRQRKAKPRVTRFLDETLWQEVKSTIEQMPKETGREREHYFRVRWLFSLFYICGVRISEVTKNTMAGFFCRRDKGEERWWLEITGKGDKTRIVPATNELMLELSRYRREKGHAPLPLPGETTPLLLPIGTQQRALTRSAVHQIVKEVFDQTAGRLRERGPEYQSRAAEIEMASAHWMRHTAASNMTSEDMDLKHVRDNLGHESIATTSKYLHSEDDLRHKETEEKHRLRW
ncbi:MAG: tyrosine-type recombinase/integrase [Gammaproteobacteria bacterium]|nr:tyrosine-type recombinase/integrase [Sideroxydans sp.]MBU4046801.1 tyrosine-type recombinase/integrase [Gammaproteobacteria bacterium]MBU4150721.1 tyrosine-type recombinase/integrase [Gammaproteobacteria bacterium]